jgi:hypothetical protein
VAHEIQIVEDIEHLGQGEDHRLEVTLGRLADKVNGVPFLGTRKKPVSLSVFVDQVHDFPDLY